MAVYVIALGMDRLDRALATPRLPGVRLQLGSDPAASGMLHFGNAASPYWRQPFRTGQPCATIRGMNAICLVVDRLHAGYLGAYGNAWIDTPLAGSAGQPVVRVRSGADRFAPVGAIVSFVLARVARHVSGGAAGAAAVAGRAVARGRGDDGPVDRRAASRPASAFGRFRRVDRDRSALAAADRRKSSRRTSPAASCR